MTIITERMRFREKVVKYAEKHNNNASAARKYHTSRQQVKRWRDRYDGTITSLSLKSTKPKRHSNEHKQWELDLIKNRWRRFKHEGLAQVYVDCQKKGYKRCFSIMLKQLKKHKVKEKPVKKKYPKSKWRPDKVTKPGEKVQIDIKYVPQHCIGWDSKGTKYYQITALDEYSRKRVCQIVDEKSVTNTALFLLDLEERMGFKIETVQTDNGREFTNDPEQNEKYSIFEKVLQSKGIRYKKTRPYSPWQNGKVERSHREDTEKFYNNRVFKSYEEMMRQHKRYMSRWNNIAKQVLGFKTSNQIVVCYLSTTVVA